jgi:hypothetical protein
MILVAAGSMMQEPEQERSSNPWDKDYDPSLNDGGSRHRNAPRTTESRGRSEQVWVNKDGVIYEQEDIKAFDRSEYE